MNKDEYMEIVSDKIEEIVEATFSGEGEVLMKKDYLRDLLQKAAVEAFAQGGDYEMDNIITAQDIADLYGVSLRRGQAIARLRHDKYGIGSQVSTRNVWIFREKDKPLLAPGLPHRPKKIRE